jgi:hypothetical protein
MSLDVIPQDSLSGGCGYISPENQRVCVYSCPMEGKCPCFPKPPEPSPEVLEENQHQKEIRNISRSTQKLVYELQHAKMKLAVLKLNQEIDKISSITPSPLSKSDTESVEIQVPEQEKGEEIVVIEK